MAVILLVEDDPDLRPTLEAILKSDGHTVRAVADGSFGVASFEQGRPDLVITDIVMPNREGIETIRMMRALDARVPIIAISGGGEMRHELSYLTLAQKLGASATLAKPFRPAELRALVKEVLAGAESDAKPSGSAMGGPGSAEKRRLDRAG